MSIETFQRTLQELIKKYNEEAENHYIDSIDLTPHISIPAHTLSPVPLGYIIEIKTTGK